MSSSARRTRTGPIALQALIETAVGLRGIDAIAMASERLEALILGPADLAASLGLPDGDPEARDEALGFARSTLLVAARAAGLAAIDGPYLRVDDEPGLRRSAERARSLGYDGKWAIHPARSRRSRSSSPPATRRSSAPAPCSRRWRARASPRWTAR